MANTAVNPVSIKGKHFIKEPLPIQAANVATTDWHEMQVNVASGGAATITLTAPTDRGIALVRLVPSYRVATASGSIQVSDGTNQWGPFSIILAGPQKIDFDPPMLFAKGGTLTITMADGSQAKDLYAQGFVEGNSLV